MIERNDLEAKFREIQQVVGETREAAKNTGIMIGIGVVVLLVLVFLFGRRRGKKGSAQLQIYRLG